MQRARQKELQRDVLLGIVITDDRIDFDKNNSFSCE